MSTLTPSAQATSSQSGIADEPPAGRIGVGDSIMVGATTLLRRAGFQVNARVGRQFATAPAILRSYGGDLPRDVVIELGTNGYVRMSDCRSVLAIVGPRRRVYFVNNHMNRSWQNPNNRTLRRCAARAADRAQVIDWHLASDNAWDWFAPDRVHLSRSGSVALATMIDAAVDAQEASTTLSAGR